MDKITSKLKELRDKYPDTESQEMLNDWEKSAKVAIVTANLQNNDAIKLIIAEYQKEYISLKKTLSDEPSLFKDADGHQLGLLIHERIKWCKKFLNIFASAQSKLDNVDKHLENLIKEQ